MGLPTGDKGIPGNASYYYNNEILGLYDVGPGALTSRYLCVVIALQYVIAMKKRMKLACQLVRDQQVKGEDEHEPLQYSDNYMMLLEHWCRKKGEERTFPSCSHLF